MPAHAQAKTGPLSPSSYVASTAQATRVSTLSGCVRTDVSDADDTGAGVAGVNRDSGEAERQIMFKDKVQIFEADKVSGRVFYLKKGKKLSGFLLN